MVFKFLGKGKKTEYFLEAPPANNGADSLAKMTHKVAEVADKVADTVTDKVAEVAKVADKVADEVVEKVTDVVAKVPSPSEAAKAVESAAADAKAKAKKFKKTKAKDEKAAKPVETAPSVQAVAMSAPQPEPVKNFATDFLMPASTPRRRPGPSLDMFRDMAKDVTPRK